MAVFLYFQVIIVPSWAIRHLNLNKNIDLKLISNLLKTNVTGADIGAVVNIATTKARNRLLYLLQKEAKKAAVATLLAAFPPNEYESDN